MTKKDYVAIAKALQRAGAHQNIQVFTVLAELERDLCAIFLADNPAFDEVKFLKACQP